MTTLPQRIVTMLFSDIEGSTRLVAQLGDASYGRLLDQHRGLVRAAVAAHRGVEIGTEGDSFFVVFDDPHDALRAASDAQRSLARELERVRVRMGIHTGPATHVDGDVHGLAVHQAARVAAAAHGGQVLVSDSTAQLVSETSRREELALRDLGEHRLKDLERPVRLHQLRIDGLDADFAAPRTLERVRHNLPIQSTTFVGRVAELAEVTRLLADHRLVTLTGPGGIGKTRLAYHAAADVVDGFSGGIWVAELAAVTQPSSLPMALLRSLGLKEEQGESLLDSVVRHLRERASLLVLDNCEQVISAVAEVVEVLLRRCPSLVVLASSREALRLPGEAVFTVPTLPLPADAVEALSPGAAGDAIRLFVARAAEVQPGFGVHEQNAADIAAICTRLDGLPLAIELAASRVRLLAPAQLRERLDSALDLLSKGSRTADSRQATLRGAIDWSYRLLSPSEQQLFMRLCVFSSHWDLAAAEAVCTGDQVTSGNVLDLVEALVDKSLVVAGQDLQGRPRLRLLETIRSFAAEQLEEAGETRPFRDRHAAWCLALVVSAQQQTPGTREESEATAGLDLVHGDLLEALAHLREHEADTAFELTASLGAFWRDAGHWDVGIRHLSRCLEEHPEESLKRARVLELLSELASWQGRAQDARAPLEESLAIVRAAGDRRKEGVLLCLLGAVALALGELDEVAGLLQSALQISEEAGDDQTRVRVLHGLGQAASMAGDTDQALVHWTEGLRLARELGHLSAEGNLIGHLGVLHMQRGDFEQARGHVQQALLRARELGERAAESVWTSNLGAIAQYTGDFDQARARGEDSLRLAREMGQQEPELICLMNLGELAAIQGDQGEACRRYDEGLALAASIPSSWLTLTLIEYVARTLGPAGQPETAAVLVAWGQASRDRSGIARGPEDQAAIDELVAATSAELGAEADARAGSRGAVLTDQQALELAAAGLARVSRSHGAVSGTA